MSASTRGSVAEKAKRVEQGRAALMLRSENLTTAEIATRLGLRPTTVERRIEEALQGADAEYEVEHMRVMVDVRLQYLQQRLAEVEANPSQKGASARVSALNAMRGIEADRRRLWGLDFDARVEHRG